MKFHSTFAVNAPVEVVAAFHRRPGALADISPPPLSVRMVSVPRELSQGAEMTLEIGFGPFRVRWIAGFDEVGPREFTDRLIQGPFADWVHRHEFRSVGPSTTEVVDTIEAHLSPNLIYGPVGAAMWMGLPVLFAYRRWKTRKQLSTNLSTDPN